MVGDVVALSLVCKSFVLFVGVCIVHGASALSDVPRVGFAVPGDPPKIGACWWGSYIQASFQVFILCFGMRIRGRATVAVERYPVEAASTASRVRLWFSLFSSMAMQRGNEKRILGVKEKILSGRSTRLLLMQSSLVFAWFMDRVGGVFWMRRESLLCESQPREEKNGKEE